MQFFIIQGETILIKSRQKQDRELPLQGFKSDKVHSHF
jgi:hypothetical protein